MGDYSELKRLAQEADFIGCYIAFACAATPATVLAMIADIERLRIDLQIADAACSLSIAESKKLKAEIEGLRKDAERYRWVSSGVHEAETLVSIVNCHGGYAEKIAERVDVYRDASMAAAREVSRG